MYWLALLPVHEWMFSGLLKEIGRRATLRGTAPGGQAPECASAGS